MSSAGVDQITFINVDNGFGGEGAANGLTVTGGIDGKWLIVSFSGGTIDPGYYHLTTLEIESLQSKGCLPGNFILTKGVVSDPFVSSVIANRAQAGELGVKHV